MTLFCVYLVFHWDNVIKNVFSKAGRSGLKRLKGGMAIKEGLSNLLHTTAIFQNIMGPFLFISGIDLFSLCATRQAS